MKRNRSKTHNGMTYQQLQAENRANLNKKLDKMRKKLGLKNKGWDEIIALSQWLRSKKAGGSDWSPIMQEMLADVEDMIAIHNRLDEIKDEFPELKNRKPSNIIHFPMERINHG